MTRAVTSWLAVPVGVLAAALLLLFAPVPTMQAHVLAITVFCIVVWIGNPVPPWVTGIVAIGLIGLQLSPDVALTGFESPATWLIVFGLVVGEATRRSGLATALQSFVLARTLDEDASARRTYYRLLLLLSFAGLGFALLLPAALVRVLIATPVLLEIGRAFDSREARLGIFFAPIFATYYGAVGVLTANLPNIVITGIVENLTGVSITWTDWLLQMFPVMSVARVLLIIGVVAAMYRPPRDETVSIPDAAASVSPDARRMLVTLLVGVVFWATDSIHGLHPMFGALLVAVVAILPRVGVMGYDAVEDIDFSIIFFVGAVFAIADALTKSGFTERAANVLLTLVPNDAPTAVILAAVFFVTLALSLILEGIAVSSVLTPVLVTFAASAGVNVADVAYTEAAALGVFWFPYQSVVLVVIARVSLVETRDVIKTASALSLATIAVLLPLLLGYLAVV